MTKAAGSAQPYYTTDPNNSMQNGALDPYVAPVNLTITDISLTCCLAAVSQATVGATVSARIDIYSNEATGRTLVSTQRINITPVASVGVSNNLGTPALFTGSVSGLSVTLNALQAWGIQFTNEGDTNTHLNGIGRLYVTVKTKEA